MKNKLKALFDYQKFENNKHLEKVIDESLDYANNPIKDDQLAFVYGGYGETNIKDEIHIGTSLLVRIWDMQANKYNEYVCQAESEPFVEGNTYKVFVTINGIAQCVSVLDVEIINNN